MSAVLSTDVHLACAAPPCWLDAAQSLLDLNGFHGMLQQQCLALAIGFCSHSQHVVPSRRHVSCNMPAPQAASPCKLHLSAATPARVCSQGPFLCAAQELANRGGLLPRRAAGGASGGGGSPWRMVRAFALMAGLVLVCWVWRLAVVSCMHGGRAFEPLFWRVLSTYIGWNLLHMWCTWCPQFVWTAGVALAKVPCL